MPKQPVARPFIKYPGGKRWLVPHLATILPSEYNKTYLEPFLGGGAMFFGLAARGLVTQASLSDSNRLLVSAYTAVIEDLPELLVKLNSLRNTKEDYYSVRESLNASLKSKPADLNLDVDDVAKYLYINKYGFNGLLRFNKSGEINTPYGDNPKAKFNHENLRLCNGILNSISRVQTASYECVLDTVTPRSLVFMDPPYLPLSKTSNFTSYTSQGFGEEDHVKLADFTTKLITTGAFIALTNSDTPLTRKLYSRFNISTVKVSRSINSKADKRGPVSELLITNF